MLCFEPDVSDHFPDRSPLDWALDVFPALLAHDVPFHMHEIDGYYEDIGSFEALRRGTWDLLEGRVRLPPAAKRRPSRTGRGNRMDGGGLPDRPRRVAHRARWSSGTAAESAPARGCTRRSCLPGAQVAPGELVIEGIKAQRP